MTTVGYGDVNPVTFGGRLMAGLIMLLGVGIVALPASMLAARFGEELKSRKDRLRVYVRHVLQDGHVDELEQSELEQVARELDISKDALEQLIELQKAQRHISMVCPHCGKGISTDKKS